MYRNLSDKEFLQLIFTSETRIGMDYVKEAKARKTAAVPFLSKVLKDENNYRSSEEGLGGLIHAVHLLGILGDSGVFEAFLCASRLSHKYDIDWVWDVLPECYLRLGKDVIAKLVKHIRTFKFDSDLVSEEISGLWNLWEAYPEERGRIEDFLLQVLKDRKTDPVTRMNLIADFAQLGRKDLRPLFEALCEGGSLDALMTEDLDYLFDSVCCPPTCHYDLEGFYSPEEIEAWQEGFE